MDLLNLGCGNTFHKDWINIDFASNSEHVKTHNLLEGIPFETNSIDAVYHSHVLEHFSKPDGVEFIKECHRVLKTNGLIRIAVPDLETIVKEYLKHLELAIAGQEESKQNYDWIILELFDQMVRNKSGGEMKGYLFKEEIPNETYVFERIGIEGKKIRNSFLRRQQQTQIQQKPKLFIKKLKPYVKKVLGKLKFNDSGYLAKNQSKASQIGEFRLRGEIHQWMYDRYSLSELLNSNGFSEVKVCNAFKSSIKDWESYQLDVINGEVRKPDSLFIEARKG